MLDRELITAPRIASRWRALVHRAVVLLLDEATSALDAVTEAGADLDAAPVPGGTRIVIVHL